MVCRHLPMRNVERARHVAFRVGLGAARIDEHEVDRTAGESLMHVGAIGLE